MFPWFRKLERGSLARKASLPQIGPYQRIAACFIQMVISAPQITCWQQYDKDLKTEGLTLEREAWSPQDRAMTKGFHDEMK